MKQVLISFVGTNDSGQLKGKGDGAVINTCRNRRFDVVHLIWTKNKNLKLSYEQIANHVKTILENENLCSNVKIHFMDIQNVVDHNEIYPKLLGFCRALPIGSGYKYTGAISSGTPSMQTCWILMAESGDFTIELTRANEPSLDIEPIAKVKLGTALPRIRRLEQENLKLKRNLNIELVFDFVHNSPRVRINEKQIDFMPMEFAWYKFFAQNVLDGLHIPISEVYNVKKEVLIKVNEIYKACFQSDNNSRLGENIAEYSKKGYALTNLNYHKSNIEKKIKDKIDDEQTLDQVIIHSEGTPAEKVYYIRLPAEKIKMKEREDKFNS